MLFSDYELWQRNDLDLFDFKEVPENLYKSALADGSKYLNNDWGVLTAAMYTDAQHGAFTELYRKRRIALCSLVLAEYAERKGRFFADIQNGIWCICEESTWQLPDNTATLRDIENPRFDINSARTASLLALSVHLFRKELPLEVKKRTLYEIRKRVLIPFADARQLSPENIAHTLLAYMFAEPDEEKRRMAVDKTLAALEVFLGDYSQNGAKAKNEQSLYRWTAYIFDILEILYNVTDQKFTVFSDKRVMFAAESIYKTHLGSDGFSERSQESDGARVYLFGKRMDYKKLMDFGASEFLKIEEKTLPESTNLFHKLYSLKYASEITSYGDNFDGSECGYIDSMELFVKKTKDFSVAVKGGASAAGNFMAYLENEPYVVDLEKSHNLPVVNGFVQFSNTKNAEVKELENGISVELSRTYPKEAGIISWKRTVEAEEKYIIITDEYDLEKNEDLRLVMIMKDKPILSDDRILIGGGSIVWDGSLALRAELVKSKAYDYVYRLIFHIKDEKNRGKIRIALKKN